MLRNVISGIIILGLWCIFFLCFEIEAQECKWKKAFYIYVDVSGSTYLDTPTYRSRNTVIYQGKSQKLLDATVRLLSDILSDSKLGIFKSGDYIAIKGFYSSVEPLLEVDSFSETNAPAIRELHAQLDINNSGNLDAQDFLNQFPDQNRTNFVAVLEDMSDVIQTSGDNYDVLVCLILTDGEHDAPLNFDRTLKRFAEGHRRALQQKVSLAVIGLDVTGDGQKLAEYCQGIFYSIGQGTEEFGGLAQRITQILRIPIRVTSMNLLEKGANYLSYAAILYNPACHESTLETLTMKLMDAQKTLIQERILDTPRNLSFEHAQRSEFPFRLDIGGLKADRYTLTLIPQTIGFTTPGAAGSIDFTIDVGMPLIEVKYSASMYKQTSKIDLFQPVTFQFRLVKTAGRQIGEIPCRLSIYQLSDEADDKKLSSQTYNLYFTNSQNANITIDFRKELDKAGVQASKHYQLMVEFEIKDCFFAESQQPSPHNRQIEMDFYGYEVLEVRRPRVSFLKQLFFTKLTVSGDLKAYFDEEQYHFQVVLYVNDKENQFVNQYAVSQNSETQFFHQDRVSYSIPKDAEYKLVWQAIERAERLRVAQESFTTTPEFNDLRLMEIAGIIMVSLGIGGAIYWFIARIKRKKRRAFLRSQRQKQQFGR